MDAIKVQVGSYTVGNGIEQDNTRPVEFEGERLAQRTEYGTGRGGGVSDTRGLTETLYRAADGRYLVHVYDWTKWQGEPNTYTLHGAAPEDLEPGGRWEMLGREAGLGRPLTLDEALSD